MTMGGLAQRRDLVDGIQRAEFRRLGDRHNGGLHVMWIAEQMNLAFDVLGRELGVLGGKIDEFGPGDAFGSARLVDRDMRRFGAYHRAVFGQQGLQRDDIRAAAVPGEVHVAARAEKRTKRIDGPSRPWVIPVGNNVAAIRVRQSREYFWKDARLVVAAKPPLRSR